MKKLLFFADRRGVRLLFIWLGGMLTGFTLIFPEAGVLEWITLVPSACVLLGIALRDDEPGRSRRRKRRRAAGAEGADVSAREGIDSVAAGDDVSAHPRRRKKKRAAGAEGADVSAEDGGIASLLRRPIALGRAYLFGLFFFMSFYTVIFHWFIYLYPLEFTGMSRASAAVVVMAGWFGLSLLQALAGGLVFVALVLAGRTSFVRRRPIILPFVAGALWTLHEWSQTLFWSGVPWGRLPIGQSVMPTMIQTASLFGPYFITFLIVTVNFCLALAIREAVSPKKIRKDGAAGKSPRAPRGAALVCAALLVLGNAAAGALILPLRDAATEGEPIRAALIQANIASGEKWDMKMSEILDIYADYTLDAAAESPDIIIWPESALPVVLERNPNTTKRISDLAAECAVPILAGILTEDELGGEYNSLVLFLPDRSISEEDYSKRRLVPFGEFLPMRGLITTLIPPLAKVAMLEDDVTPGADSGIITCDGVSYGALICFDSIYEGLARDSLLDGAELLVVATNDSWFYDSAAGRMHNAQAILRAVETGRYVLRAANTGISSVITPTGRVSERLDALIGGYIVADVSPRQGLTLYTITGNIFVLAAALFCLLPAGFEFAERIARRTGGGADSRR